MAIETNLNQSPYFDDFSSDKDFHRVLFRPGYGVQARELTQLQSILQTQIERFANEVVIDGTVITGCGLSTDTVGYVKLRDKDKNNDIVLLGDFYVNNKVANAVVTGETSGVTARLVDVAEGSEAAAPDYLTMFVHYTNSGANNSTKSFLDNESLRVTATGTNTTLLFANTITSESTGLGLRGGLTDGIVYHKGHFLRVENQSAIIGKYTHRPSKKVGLRTIESIVDSNQDSSLLDNATGATNFAAPGANRLKMVPTLSVYDLNFANTDNFFLIATVNNGSIEQRNEDTTYSDIGKYIASQFHDTNGNYVTDPFNIRMREHLSKINSLGRYTAAEGGDSNKLVAEIEKGRGYVNGFKFEQFGAAYIDVDKATDANTSTGVAISQAMGNYILVDEVAGGFNMQELEEVSLRTNAGNALSDGTLSATSIPGSEAGTAKVRGFEWHSGTKGTPECKYRLYLFDIQMGAGYSFSNDVKSVYIANSMGSGKHSLADAVLESGKAVLKETSLLPLVYKTGFFATKTHNDVQWVTRKRFEGIGINTSGVGDATLNTDGGDTLSTGGSEDFNDGGTTISLEDHRKYIIVSRTATKTADATGYISTISGTTITGVGTTFSTDFKVGDLVDVTISSTETEIGYIESIDSNTQITLTATALATLSGGSSSNKCRASMPVGYVWNLQNQESPSILSEPSNGTLDINFQRTFDQTFTVDIYFDVVKTSAIGAKKTVNKNKFVRINTGSHPSSKTGPYSLGVSDAFKLVKVYKGANTTPTTANEDVTNHFELVTGQKDAMYDTSFIRQKSTSSLDLTNVGLLVEFNYFTPSFSGGYGFYNFDSYADIIDDANPDASNKISTQEVPVYVSPTSGKKYDLRDCVDYRPRKASTATPTSDYTTAPSNPSVSTTFDFNASYGAYMPSPSENYQADIEFYLRRKDLVVVSQRGNFEVIKGVPSVSPRTPDEPAGTMTLGVVEVTPYPSLSPYVANVYNRQDYRVSIDVKDNRRYTMKDLRAVEQRVQNLEYYSSLNALENSAKSKQIFNNTGQDRFKNGFFVDNFTGHQNAAVQNRNYRAAIDTRFNRLVPKFIRSDVKLKKDGSFTSTNVATAAGGNVTLPYEHTPIVEQTYATKLRNPVQELLFNWRGQVTMSPEADNTPDITTAPDVQLDFSGINDALMELMEWTDMDEGVTLGDWDRNGRTRTRDVTEIEVETAIESIDLGPFITDVSVREYMRSIEIQVTGFRMRPNTRVYAYFDEEKVSAYCTPCNSNFEPTGVEGDPMITDEFGTVYALFRLPNDENLKFRTGTKQFKFQDIADPITEASLVTTSGIGSFTSQALDIVQQGTQVNLVYPQITKNVRVETQTWHTVADGDRGWWDPLAQSFAINISGSTDGAYITKVDLYFGKKSNELPVTLQIRNMQTGFPIATIVPYGQKTLYPSDINIDDGNLTNPTTFQFDNPVFLQNNEDYALVIVPGGNSDDYAVWVAELGGTDINTNLLISKQTYPGVMFTSANDNTWNPIQNEDLTFKIYRAEFDTDVTGTIYVENEDMDFFKYDNRKDSFRIGETVRAESILTFANNDSVAVGDVLFSKESTNTLSSNYANGTIRQIVSSGSGSVTVKVDALGDFPTETASNTNCLYLNSAGRADAAWIGNTTSFTANTATGKVHFINDDAGKMHVTAVNIEGRHGPANVYGFANNHTWVRGQKSGATMRVTELEDVAMNLIVPKIPQLTYPRTSAVWEARTTSGSTIGKFQNITLSTDNNFYDNEKVIKSRSHEEELAAVNGSKKSLVLRGTFSTSRSSISPVIDTSRMNGLVVNHIINNDGSGEEENAGNAQVRYISKTITLADGQDAEDLVVYVNAFKPKTTDVQVYAKILNAEDGESMDDKKYTLLRQVTTANTYSEGVDGTDVREFEFTFSANTDGQNFLANSQLNTALLDTNDGDIVGYTNSDGSFYKGYKHFAIKIVMTASGSQLVPYVRDLRSVALQK
jgi:hypothetical protein